MEKVSLSMKNEAFQGNTVLFGADPTEGIVAVEPLDDKTMRLFIRSDDRLEPRDEPFTPFILLEDIALIKGFKKSFQTEPLTSTNPFRTMAVFNSWGDCQKARAYLQEKTRETPSSPHAPYLFLSDPVYQYLLKTGRTLFKTVFSADQ